MRPIVIRTIYQTESDLYNLSTIRSVITADKVKDNYSGWIISKPWGYEFLAYQNNHVAVWFLYIKKNHSTSFHCHPRKKSALLVLDGRVTFSTLNSWYDLSQMDAINIDSSVFHTTSANSTHGAYVLELETPPLKHDLVRLKDSYGRVGTTYEDASHFIKPHKKHHYFFLNKDKISKELDMLKYSFTLILSNNNEHDRLYDYRYSNSVCCNLGIDQSLPEMVVKKSDQFPHLLISKL